MQWLNVLLKRAFFCLMNHFCRSQVRPGNDIYILYHDKMRLTWYNINERERREEANTTTRVIL